MLSRRAFLRNILTATAIAAIPTPLLGDFYSGKVDTIISDDFLIDYRTGRIEYIGATDKQYTVLELYNYLKQEMYK